MEVIGDGELCFSDDMDNLMDPLLWKEKNGKGCVIFFVVQLIRIRSDGTPRKITVVLRI